jgi:hypothetical protein
MMAPIICRRTRDIAVGQNVTKNSAAPDGTNLNAAFLDWLANSSGTHYQNPREIAAQVRCKFKY